MAQPTIFADSDLPTALVDNLRRFNPWWEDEAMPVQPPTRRHLVGQIRRRLDVNVAPIVVVRGPRQIGKTTAQFQIIQDLLREGVHPRRILRVQFDDLGTLKRLPEPILRISDWFERRIAPKRFNTLAEAGSPAYLFFDELQNLDGWDAQLKSLVDNASVKVVVTGSSALRIELGRDSLAGRINTIEAGVLSLTEIGALRGYATIHGLDVAHFPERGTDREVDFVLTVGGKRIPVEVKYQRRIDPFRDTLGIRSFLDKSSNNAPFGILVTQDYSGTPDDPRIVTLPLSTFMMLR